MDAPGRHGGAGRSWLCWGQRTAAVAYCLLPCLLNVLVSSVMVCYLRAAQLTDSIASTHCTATAATYFIAVASPCATATPASGINAKGKPRLVGLTDASVERIFDAAWERGGRRWRESCTFRFWLRSATRWCTAAALCAQASGMGTAATATDAAATNTTEFVSAATTVFAVRQSTAATANGA
jgi:hypothetical protein